MPNVAWHIAWGNLLRHAFSPSDSIPKIIQKQASRSQRRCLTWPGTLPATSPSGTHKTVVALTPKAPVQGKAASQNASPKIIQGEPQPAKMPNVAWGVAWHVAFGNPYKTVVARERLQPECRTLPGTVMARCQKAAHPQRRSPVQGMWGKAYRRGFGVQSSQKGWSCDRQVLLSN